MSVGLYEEGFFGKGIPVVDDVVEVSSSFSTQIWEVVDNICAGGVFERGEGGGVVFGVDYYAGREGAEVGC